RAAVDREVVDVRQELRAGRRRRQESYALAQGVVTLMHMAPHDGAYVTMPVDDMQELGRIRQPHTIEPAAGHRHRMVVQAHHAMARAGACQGRLEPGEGRRAQGATGRAWQAAVEQHDTPAPQVHETAEHERLSE